MFNFFNGHIIPPHRSIFEKEIRTLVCRLDCYLNQLSLTKVKHFKTIPVRFTKIRAPLLSYYIHSLVPA